MLTAKAFRERAEECRRLSRSAPTAMCDQFQKLADAYEGLAEQYEHAEAEKRRLMEAGMAMPVAQSIQFDRSAESFTKAPLP